MAARRIAIRPAQVAASAIAAMAVSVWADSAGAGTVLIEGIAAPFTAESGTVADLYRDGPGVMSHDALFRAHEAIQASGIVTDRRTTIVLMDTDRGLSLAALIDDETIRMGSHAFDSQIGIDATAPQTAESLVNGLSDLTTMTPAGADGRREISGTFTWKSERRGDALAWAGLDLGDSGEFRFTEDGEVFPTLPGLAATRQFQFVSWSQAQQSWQVLSRFGFDERGEFAFQWTIIPLPSAAFLGLAGLAVGGAAALVRRRATGSINC